jgi:hypothetical protein
VSSCSDVCPLCWLPRRLVYVRHVRILDSKKKEGGGSYSYVFAHSSGDGSDFGVGPNHVSVLSSQARPAAMGAVS